MDVLRLVCGIVAAMAAVFAGGCSLLFGGGFLIDGDEYGLMIIPAMGLGAAIGLGFVARLLLRRP